MPWCDTCDEYRAPTAVKRDQTCPTCGNVVDMEDVKVAAPVRAPWHFWVMVIALVAYLGWRAIEGVLWIFGLI